MNVKKKLIVIVGTTAVGKTKLSIELAKRLKNAPHEVISADSVQVYRDLPITSAMVTKEEACGIKHHILDFLEPRDLYSANEFSINAMPIAESLLKQDKLPIVAGGTFLWVEGLVFENYMSAADNEEKETKHEMYKEENKANMTPEAKEKLWQELFEVDPTLAQRVHPNDVYRIRRGLHVFKETGVPLSEQMKQHGGRYGEQRFEAVFLWLDAHMEVLNERISKRVDEMVKAGMLEEVWSLFLKLKKLGWTKHDPVTFPVTQTFGFTVFLPYLMQRFETGKVDEKIVKECLDKLKNDTRKYAKKQKRWIQNRLQEIPCSVYRLDASDVATWSKRALEPAIEICNCFQDDLPLPDAKTFAHLMTLPELEAKKKKPERWESGVHFCEVCERKLIGNAAWNDHIKSKNHRRKLKYERLQEKLKKEGYIGGSKKKKKVKETTLVEDFEAPNFFKSDSDSEDET